MSRLKVKKFTCNILFENCYIVYDKHKALIIDPGSDYFKINTFLKNNNLNVLAVLLTHGHFDHCLSCKKFQDDGAVVYIHKLDADKLYSDGNLSSMFGIDFQKFYADCLIEEGDLEIGEFEIKVLHTPGHSKGSVCYIIDNNFFSGDTFFKDGVGRTDFYDSSPYELKQSLNKLQHFFKNNYNFFYGH